MTPRVGGRDDRAGSPAPARYAATLRSRIAPDSSGCEHGVRAARAATQAVVVGVVQVVGRAEHGPDRAVGLLDVAQVARILDDDRAGCGRVPGTPVRATHSEKSSTRAANACGLGRAEQAAVLLHTGAAPGAVDHDRRRSRHRRHDASGERACFLVATCVHVQRSAARTLPGPGRATCAPAARITRAVARWVSRIHASITQPVNSHASGSPPSATSSRRRLRGRTAGCRTASARGAGAGRRGAPGECKQHRVVRRARRDTRTTPRPAGETPCDGRAAPRCGCLP